MEKLFSVELLERIKNEQTEFDDIELHYPDLQGKFFKNLKFKNSKFFYVLFYGSTFENVTFENCEIFFASMGGGIFKNVKFINCKIDYSGFTGSIFVDSEMIDSKISWTAFIDANLAGLGMRNCVEHKVFRNASDITLQDLETGLSNIGRSLDELDFSLKQKANDIVTAFLKENDLNATTSSSSDKSPYKNSSEGSALESYKIFDTIVGSIVDAYKTDSPYNAKKKDVYMNK